MFGLQRFEPESKHAHAVWAVSLWFLLKAAANIAYVIQRWASVGEHPRNSHRQAQMDQKRGFSATSVGASLACPQQKIICTCSLHALARALAGARGHQAKERDPGARPRASVPRAKGVQGAKGPFQAMLFHGYRNGLSLTPSIGSQRPCGPNTPRQTGCVLIIEGLPGSASFEARFVGLFGSPLKGECSHVGHLGS